MRLVTQPEAHDSVFFMLEAQSCFGGTRKAKSIKLTIEHRGGEVGVLVGGWTTTLGFTSLEEFWGWTPSPQIDFASRFPPRQLEPQMLELATANPLNVN